MMLATRTHVLAHPSFSAHYSTHRALTKSAEYPPVYNGPNIPPICRCYCLPLYPPISCGALCLGRILPICYRRLNSRNGGALPNAIGHGRKRPWLTSPALGLNSPDGRTSSTTVTFSPCA